MSILMKDALIIRETKDYHKDELINTVKISNYGLPILRKRGYYQFENNVAKSIIFKSIEDRSEIMNQLVQKFPSFKTTFMYEKMNTVMEMWNNRTSIMENKKRYDKVRGYHNKSITNIFFLSDDDIINKTYDIMIKYLQTPKTIKRVDDYLYTFPINYININESTIDKLVITYCDNPNEFRNKQLSKEYIKTFNDTNDKDMFRPSNEEIKNIIKKLYDLKRLELDIKKVEEKHGLNHVSNKSENAEKHLLMDEFDKKYDELVVEIEKIRFRTEQIKDELG